MSTPKHPGFTARVRTVRDTGEEVGYYSNRPFNKPQYISPRVPEWDTITRGLSDEQGSYKEAQSSLTLSDDDEDSKLRTAVAENPTRYQKDTEVKLSVLSHVGRAADLAERTLLRGKLDGPPQYPIDQPETHLRRRRLQLKLVDALKPYLDSYINKEVFSRDRFPKIDRAIENTRIPIIGGEFSDAGAVDVAGNTAELGMVPLIYAGTWHTTSDDPLGSESAFIAAPSGVSVLATNPGSRVVYYGVTFFSASGETTQTIYQLESSATTISPSDYNTVSWTAAGSDVTHIAVYRGDYPTPNKRIALLDPSQVSYVDGGTSVPVSISPPLVNQAQIPDEDGGFNWDLWVVCLGVVGITGLFGSDDARGAAPKRINILDTAGVDFLIPGYTGWVGSTLYLEIDDLWLTCILGRGPRSQQAKDGIVTLAVSTCGLTDVSDGSGEPIQQYFPLVQHFLNQFLLLNRGLGWKKDGWGALETFSDGVEIINTETVQAMQDLTKLFLDDDHGYQGHIYLREPTTGRQFLEMACQTADAYCGTNHHGQLMWSIFDPDVDTSSARILRQYIELQALEAPEIDNANLEPNVRFQYDYNPDTDAYRSEIEWATDEEFHSEVAVGLQDEATGVRLLRFTRDQNTARDAMHRRKARLRGARYRQAFICKLAPGLDIELGDVVMISHPDGPLPRWSSEPFFIISHEVIPKDGTVRLEGYRLESVIPSPSASPSASFSPSASVSPSASRSVSPSSSVSKSHSASPSVSLSPSRSPSSSQSPSHSQSPSSSISPSVSPSSSRSPSSSQSPSSSISSSASRSASPSSSVSPSASRSVSASVSPSHSRSPSISPSPSPSSGGGTQVVAGANDVYAGIQPVVVTP